MIRGDHPAAAVFGCGAGETEGARRATGVSPAVRVPAAGLTGAFAATAAHFSGYSQYPPSMFHKSRRDMYNRTHGSGGRLQNPLSCRCHGVAAVIEPGCVVLRELHIDRFQPALLGIAYCSFHACVSSLCALCFLIETLLQPVALPTAIDDVCLMG